MHHIKDLTPDPQNARKHGPRNVGLISDALREVGFARSIVIDEDGTVLAGNATVEACAEAGITKLQVVEADGETVIAVRRRDLGPEQKARLALFDNRAAELAEGWDADALKSLQEAGVSLAGLWTDEEARALFLEPASGLTDPDAIPDDRATDIKAGDLFELGQHRLLCGNTLEAKAIARLAESHPVDLIVTSPPYNQQLDHFKPSGMHRDGGWVQKVERLAYSDSLPEADYQRQQREAIMIWHGILREGGSVFYNHKHRYREKAVVTPLTWLLDGPLRLRQEIVWARPGSVTQNARMFIPSDERIYWLYKGEDFTFDDATEVKSWSTVWNLAIEPNRTHAAGFPVALPSRAIKACSHEGDHVLDPYVGSGTTIIACERLSRRCLAMEIDPRYVQVAIERWEAFTGQKAVKVGVG